MEKEDSDVVLVFKRTYCLMWEMVSHANTGSSRKPCWVGLGVASLYGSASPPQGPGLKLWRWAGVTSPEAGVLSYLALPLETCSGGSPPLFITVDTSKHMRRKTNTSAPYSQPLRFSDCQTLLNLFHLFHFIFSCYCVLKQIWIICLLSPVCFSMHLQKHGHFLVITMLTRVWQVSSSVVFHRGCDSHAFCKTSLFCHFWCLQDLWLGPGESLPWIILHGRFFLEFFSNERIWGEFLGSPVLGLRALTAWGPKSLIPGRGPKISYFTNCTQWPEKKRIWLCTRCWCCWILYSQADYLLRPV